MMPAGPIIPTALDMASPEAQARAAHNRALAQDLREKVARAALGAMKRAASAIPRAANCWPATGSTGCSTRLPFLEVGNWPPMASMAMKCPARA
jgi:3-methylcrotonyl-CoA carboxylase beta subunit